MIDGNNDSDHIPPFEFVKVVGRLKEIIITSGGENIAPTLIESEMKTSMPALSTCIVLGDGRKFLSMMISLKVFADSESGIPKDNLTEEVIDIGKVIGSTAMTYTAAKIDPLWIKYIDDGMALANSITLSNSQKIQKWVWIPHDISEATEELNAQLKLRRKFVNEKYSYLIDSIYNEPVQVVPSTNVLI